MAIAKFPRGKEFIVKEQRKNIYSCNKKDYPGSKNLKKIYSKDQTREKTINLISAIKLSCPADLN
jgi:hypothetical protein